MARKPVKKTATKKETVKKETVVMNGDPTVVTPVVEETKIEQEVLDAVEEIVEAKVEEPVVTIAKTLNENKITNRVDNLIGYSWNGMEMDTY